jgi:hypothetical protein
MSGWVILGMVVVVLLAVARAFLPLKESEGFPDGSNSDSAWGLDLEVRGDGKVLLG